MAQGAALRDVAPNLYKRVRFKNRSVAFELQNHNWIRNIHRINSTNLLDEYVTLLLMISGIYLNSERCYCLEMDDKWKVQRGLGL
jgi:hypothetical protein